MNKGPVKLAPSILAADFARLGEQVAEAEQAGADRIHIDVMDGHFVSNLSMGAPIVASLRRVTRLPLETHLLISDPDFFPEEFVDAGSDSFLVHWEGNANLHRTVQGIKALGKRAGVAINPATPAAVLEEILQDIEQVLIMTVNPGFGHQHFIPTTLPKIRRVRSPLAVAAGANVLVAGTSIFGESEGVRTACEPGSSYGTNSLKESSDDDINKGVSYANWNDWSWKDGRKHGAPATEERTDMRSF